MPESGYSFDQQSVQRITSVVRFVESRFGQLNTLTGESESPSVQYPAMGFVRGVLTTPLSRGGTSYIVPISRTQFPSYFLYLSGFFNFPFDAKYKIIGKENNTTIWTTGFIPLSAENDELSLIISNASKKDAFVLSFSSFTHYIVFNGAEELFLQYQTVTAFSGIELTKTLDAPYGNVLEVFDPYLLPSDMILPAGTTVFCAPFSGEGHGVVQYVPRQFQLRTVEATA